ncbi:MAG: hypothetical protein M3440_00985 [Chloroflexota bacterium]|nr:hypothetical protein [Chloroflexota bacterium]
MGSLIDITGQRFGRLEVLRRQKNAPSGQTRYLVLCDCGKTKVTQRNLLVSGNSTFVRLLQPFTLQAPESFSSAAPSTSV